MYPIYQSFRPTGRYLEFDHESKKNHNECEYQPPFRNRRSSTGRQQEMKEGYTQGHRIQKIMKPHQVIFLEPVEPLDHILCSRSRAKIPVNPFCQDAEHNGQVGPDKEPCRGLPCQRISFPFQFPPTVRIMIACFYIFIGFMIPVAFVLVIRRHWRRSDGEGKQYKKDQYSKRHPVCFTPYNRHG